jgi:hypothetical protein
VRAIFAPRHPEAAGTTPGAMTASSIGFPNTLCKVDTYHHLFVADVDNDKQLELYVDLTTSRLESSGTRTGNFGIELRDLFIWDGGPAFDAEIRLRDTTPGGFTSDSAEPVELQDVDGDGHVDLIQLGPSDSEKTVHLYDKADDAWSVAVDPKPQPAAGSADTPALPELRTQLTAGSAATPPASAPGTPPAAANGVTRPASASAATSPAAGSAGPPPAAGSAATPPAAGSAGPPPAAGSATKPAFTTPPAAGSPTKPPTPAPAIQPPAGDAAKP